MNKQAETAEEKSRQKVSALSFILFFIAWAIVILANSLAFVLAHSEKTIAATFAVSLSVALVLAVAGLICASADAYKRRSFGGLILLAIASNFITVVIVACSLALLVWTSYQSSL